MVPLSKLSVFQIVSASSITKMSPREQLVLMEIPMTFTLHLHVYFASASLIKPAA